MTLHSDHDRSERDRMLVRIDLAIRLGFLALLLYLSFVLIRPFITIAIWSVVLTVALYPIYKWLLLELGGRRRLASILLTIFSLLIVVGPATWLVLSLIDSLKTLSEHFNGSMLTLPPPPSAVREWPLIGGALYRYWDFASENLREAFGVIAPQLKPIGSAVIALAADAGTGTLQFLVSVVIAGFLYPSAPKLVGAVGMFSRKLALERGEEFLHLAEITIRAVSRGVIGIAALQAVLVGVGVKVVGLAGVSLITSAVLILGIIQIGPGLVTVPLMIWCWMTMDALTALMFTAYTIPVTLLDNVLRPLILGRGLQTPMLIIFMGVLGGTISYGISGLFLGPIVLAVIWELIVAWTKEIRDSA